MNDIKINEYIYFDRDNGVFRLTEKSSEIIYRQKGLICSYSGADEWINFFVLEMMNFYTGASPYNYALNTCDHHEAIPRLFSEDKEAVCTWVEASLTTEWGKHMYQMIENIIEDVPSWE